MKETAVHVARLMAASARTAPKGGGKDFLEIVVISEDAELAAIAAHMRAYAPESSNETYWLRDAANIDECQALVLVGLRAVNAAGYDCGAFGR